MEGQTPSGPALQSRSKGAQAQLSRGWPVGARVQTRERDQGGPGEVLIAWQTPARSLLLAISVS